MYRASDLGGQFGKAKMQMLSEHQDDICISVYLPCQRLGADIKVVPSRLAQILDNVEQQLIIQGYTPSEARNLLQPARTLPKGARAPFWQGQQEGLALFLGKGFFAYYEISLAFPEQVSIGHRFTIRPLVPLLSGDGIYYVLAVSEKQVRFFRGTRFTMEELNLAHGPHSLAETLRYDEFEKQLSQHSAASSGRGGGVASIFHGQGDAGDAAIHRQQLMRFLHEVDEEIYRLTGESPVPLILSGVEAIQGLYRTVSRYPTISEEGISGSPDRLSPEYLHQRAWEIVAPHFQRGKKRAIERFCYLYAKRDHHTQHDWRNVVLAAYSHRIETLFVPAGVPLWGTFDEKTTTISLDSQQEPNDEDLVNVAAIHTLRNGGVVYELCEAEMPFHLPVAAILRT